MAYLLTGYGLWEYQRTNWSYCSKEIESFSGESAQARQWCRENIGIENIDWVEWNRDISSLFGFRTLEDLVFVNLVH